jgi:hypothetical protein
MTAAINPEDMALHNKNHIEQAIEELARRLPEKDPTEAFITAMGASLHYIFEIAAERYGYPGVSFLERMVPGYALHALTGETPDDGVTHNTETL